MKTQNIANHYYSIAGRKDRNISSKRPRETRQNTIETENNINKTDIQRLFTALADEGKQITYTTNARGLKLGLNILLTQLSARHQLNKDRGRMLLRLKNFLC